MLTVAIMNVRQAGEACRERFAYVLLALVARAPRLAPARHLQHAIVGKERHDAIKVVRVEGLAECDQCRSNIHMAPVARSRDG
jgi:hypothetical protein